jgi:hypothetical protein
LKIAKRKIGIRKQFTFFILKREATLDREKVEEVIRAKAKGGKLPCAVCFKIAEDFGISNKEMGKILNQMKVKISHCQLGCFG